MHPVPAFFRLSRQQWLTVFVTEFEDSENSGLSFLGMFEASSLPSGAWRLEKRKKSRGLVLVCHLLQTFQHMIEFKRTTALLTMLSKRPIKAKKIKLK